MSRAPSVPPAPADDRSPDPHVRPSISYDSVDSTREVAQEDFLFHLYRGSELLQENRVIEAKEQLEYALTMQPSDPKGQDLLGAVYFRLGLYPRAIQIYEALEAAFSNDASIKVNLALCCLKTGQPEPARRALQDAVRIHPEHKRAWGYLGLALQKLGELDQAQIAFERGGQDLMARRLAEKRLRSVMPAAPESPTDIDPGVRSMAETAFSELDGGQLRFSLAAPANLRPSDGTWHTLELGDAVRPSGTPRRTAPPPASVPASAPPHESASVPPTSASAPLAAPLDPVRIAPEQAGPIGVRAAPSLLALPQGETLGVHASGAVVARVDPDHSFAVRLDALRVVAGTVTTRALHRRAREVDSAEILGGIGSPLVRITGDATVVLGSRPSHRLSAFALGDEIAFVREEVLLGFDLSLTYESGRLILDTPGDTTRPSDGVPLVQLRGRGNMVLETTGDLASIPCAAAGSLLVRREWVLAWLGRLVPRALSPGEAPSGQRGLVAFAGEGAVLVCTG